MEWENVKQIILMYLLSHTYLHGKESWTMFVKNILNTFFPLLVSINFPFITLIKTP